MYVCKAVLRSPKMKMSQRSLGHFPLPVPGFAKQKTHARTVPLKIFKSEHVGSFGTVPGPMPQRILG